MAWLARPKSNLSKSAMDQSRIAPDLTSSFLKNLALLLVFYWSSGKNHRMTVNSVQILRLFNNPILIRAIARSGLSGV
jgi:hypothetical protein